MLRSKPSSVQPPNAPIKLFHCLADISRSRGTAIASNFSWSVIVSFPVLLPISCWIGLRSNPVRPFVFLVDLSTVGIVEPARRYGPPPRGRLHAHRPSRSPAAWARVRNWTVAEVLAAPTSLPDIV